MQDFNKYSYEITISDLEKAFKEGYKPTIIINGEYYSLKEAKKEGSGNNERKDVSY